MNQVIKVLLIGFSFFSVFDTADMAAQSSNIYAFNIMNSGDNITLSNARILTAFNANGNNIDPTFINESTLLISSDYFDDSQQDIVKMDMSTKKLTRLTQTPQSELQPAVVSDGKFTVLLKENDSRAVLHSYPLNLSDGGSTLISNMPSITNYKWTKKEQSLYTLEGQGRLLELEGNNYNKNVLLDNVKGNLLIDKYKHLVFAHSLSSNSTLLKKYDTIKKEYKTYAKTINSTTVLTYLDNHKILAASGSKLYLYNLVTTSLWEQVADLTEYGIDNISELVIEKNTLIVVAK